MNITQALKSQEKHEYKKSIVEFLTGLDLPNAFEVLTKPLDAYIIGPRWVCKKKYDCNGNILKYKPRLTPFRSQQKYGRDYGETFAPVAMNRTNRLLFCVAAVCKRKPEKGDVTNAFQNDLHVYS